MPRFSPFERRKHYKEKLKKKNLSATDRAYAKGRLTELNEQAIKAKRSKLKGDELKNFDAEMKAKRKKWWASKAERKQKAAEYKAQLEQKKQTKARRKVKEQI